MAKPPARAAGAGAKASRAARPGPAAGWLCGLRRTTGCLWSHFILHVMDRNDQGVSFPRWDSAMLELNPQGRLGRSLGRGLLPPAQSDAAPAPADTTVLGATALGRGGEGGGCGGRTRAGAGEGVCREYSDTRRAWAPTPALPRSSRVASGEGLTPSGPSALGAKSAHRPTPLSCGCREDQGGGRVALPRVAPLTGPPGSQLSPRADAHSVTQRGKDRTGGEGMRQDN